MVKRYTKTLVVLLLALMLAVGAVVYLPVLAWAADGDEGEGKDPTPTSALSVTGVEYNLADKIYEGNWFTLYVHVFDSRPAAPADPTAIQPNEYPTPNAMLNTSSFTGGFMGASTIEYDQAAKGWRYIMPFDLTYTGKGNSFQCEIFYQHGHSHIAMVPYSLTFNQCVETETLSSSASSSSDPIIVGTGFVLKSVHFGDSQVNAGNSFDLDLELMTTSGSYGVNNVAVAVTPSKEFTIAAGASNIYIGNLKPNSSFPVKVPLTASATVEEGSYKVDLTVSGVGAHDGTAVTATITVTIPIVQPERFEFGNIQLPENLTAGMDDGSGYGTVNLVNKGKGVIYNVTVDLIGEGVHAQEGSQFIGNINAGSENSVDVTVMADNPGTVKAQLVVSYENAKGQQKTLTHEFSIDVMPGMDIGGEMPMPMPEPEPESTGPPVWVWVVLALVVAGVVVLIVVLAKKRNKRRAAALEDDQDEDI